MRCVVDAFVVHCGWPIIIDDIRLDLAHYNRRHYIFEFSYGVAVFVSFTVHYNCPLSFLNISVSQLSRLVLRD